MFYFKDVIQPRSLDEPIITIEDFPESFQSLPHSSEPSNVDEITPITVNHKEADHILTHQQSEYVPDVINENDADTAESMRFEKFISIIAEKYRYLKKNGMTNLLFTKMMCHFHYNVSGVFHFGGGGQINFRKRGFVFA